MKLAWPIDIASSGIAFGYSVLNQSLRGALETQGVEISAYGEIGMFVGPADLFRPYKPANVLFTMYETETIPPDWVEKCNQADLVVVPCKQNVEAFRRSGVTVPMAQVPLGLDPDCWPAVRRVESNPFRVLFVGWPNQRKGMDVLAQAFLGAFLDDINTELYFKTSQAYSEGLRRYTLGGIERLVVDDRPLEHRELVALYHSAHVFVLASRGEGWGMPAMEAMATGCPVVATGYGGLVEFVTPETGWPIRHGWSTVEYGHMTTAAEPDVVHLIEHLRWIRANYEAAAAKALWAAKKIKGEFTWQQTAHKLIQAIERTCYPAGLPGGEVADRVRTYHQVRSHLEEVAQI